MTRTPRLRTRPIRIIGSDRTYYYAEAVDQETGIACGTTGDTADEARQRAYELYLRRSR